MEPFTLTLDVGFDTTSLVVSRPAVTPSGPICWADDRRYVINAPVAVQVLCATLLALARPQTADDATQELCEQLAMLW